MRPLAALLFAALLTACASTPGGDDSYPQATPRTVWIVGADGRALGQANFTGGSNGVLIQLEFSERALTPGWHGLHLHDRGDCSDFAAGFQASGGHLGMNRRIQHGLMNPEGPEAGDLPNIFAPPSGPFGAEVFAPYTTLSSERVPGNANARERLALLDEDGSALLIHAARDDQMSQPIGNAGARIACAALTPRP
jgi:superoxide dismutase, Cu-Zn family